MHAVTLGLMIGLMIVAANLTVAQEVLFEKCRFWQGLISTEVWCLANETASLPGYLPMRNPNVSATKVTSLVFEGYSIDEIPAGSFANLSFDTLTIIASGLKRITRNSFQDILSGPSSIKFSDNRIEQIDADAFAGLKNLSFVNLDDNELVDLDQVLNATRGLPVDRLSLARNKITSLPKKCVGLESLSLDGNDIRNISANSLAGCEKLKFLYLQNNRLSSISDERMKKFPEIENLYLDNNYLSKVPSIATMSYLQRVTLNNQNGQLKHIGAFAFEREATERLLEIDLDNNDIESFDDRAFCSRYTRDIYLYEIVLTFNTFRALDKCMLKQLEIEFQIWFSWPYVTVRSTSEVQDFTEVCTCELYFFALKNDFTLRGACDDTFRAYELAKACNESAYKDPCIDQPKYKCPPPSSSAIGLRNTFMIQMITAIFILFHNI